MTPENDTYDDESLRALTRWDGPATELWKAALTSSAATKHHPRSASSKPPIMRSWRLVRPTPRTVALAAGLVLVAGLAITVAVTNDLAPWRLREADFLVATASRPSSPPPNVVEIAGSQFKGGDMMASTDGWSAVAGWQGMKGFDLDANGGGGGSEPGKRAPVFRKGMTGGDFSTPYAAGPVSATSPLLDSSLIDRSVVRKAAIDLVATDVRAAFFKATAVIREADGEYIEESRLWGNDEHAQGTLRLRVRTDRMGETLAQLRELGEVANEQVSGDDVTAQVVDLEARLRNERRIETEVLGLLDSRPDAALKDVLELREQLNRIRGGIERIVGEQERLSRLVALSSVSVTFRAPVPPDAPPPPQPKLPSLGDYFHSSLHSSWTGAIHTLSDGVAFIVGLAIGGLPWWIGLGFGAVVIRGALRRRVAAGLM